MGVTPPKPPSGSARTTTALASRFSDVRSRTEQLADALSAEDQTVQSMPDASPAKWHLAHVTWFFETFLLGPHLSGYTPFDSEFSYLFNSYYNGVGERHARAGRGMITRPSVERIREYRAFVDYAVLELLDRPDRAVEVSPELMADLMELGLHHEQQHQELLLMDIKHLLSLNPIEPAYSPTVSGPSSDPGNLGWVEFDEGEATIGLLTGSDGFAFDNEYPQHTQLVGRYALGDRLITAGEWLDFMADDGYHRPELWLSDGWYRRIAEEWQAPLYWKSDRGWQLHTLTGTHPVDRNEPVCHISFYEADAYATWAGARLPTELEWEHAANLSTQSTLHRQALHPEVAAQGEPGTELRQLFGDCWEWTGSAYRPYPRYEVPPGAIGEYNGKFMINTMVLRGGSAFTPSGHVRPTYRNFFHPQTRWHLSGLRLAKDL